MLNVTDYAGPVLADKVYVNGVMAARDVEIELPEVKFGTGSFYATGDMDFPVPAMVENMELTIKKIGEDKGLLSMLNAATKKKTIECRWVNDCILQNATSQNQTCRAYMDVLSQGAPAKTVKPGEAEEMECKFTVVSYKLMVGSQIVTYVDKLKHKVVTGGEDVYSDIEWRL